MIQDSFHRKIEYVRIAITDRCNLRCFYCMPKEGIPYEPKKELLSYEEIIRLLKILGLLGFKKVRFTGGEPFLRKDFVKLLTKTKTLRNQIGDITKFKKKSAEKPQDSVLYIEDIFTI